MRFLLFEGSHFTMELYVFHGIKNDVIMCISGMILCNVDENLFPLTPLHFVFLFAWEIKLSTSFFRDFMGGRRRFDHWEINVKLNLCYRFAESVWWQIDKKFRAHMLTLSNLDRFNDVLNKRNCIISASKAMIKL
jgi:hypothetical protein